MDHFIRIAFWIVTLSGCLPAKSQPINNFDREFVQKMIKCPSGSKFYSPSNVEKQCITAALDCFLAELQTVTEECEDPNGEIKQTAEILEMIKDDWKNASSDALENSRECACESWAPTSFTNFVNKMESLLQFQHTLNINKKGKK